jgi:hypothetical protein
MAPSSRHISLGSRLSLFLFMTLMNGCAFFFLVSSDETSRGRAGLCLHFHFVPLILLILSSLPLWFPFFVLLDVLNASRQGAFSVYNSAILIQSMMKKIPKSIRTLQPSIPDYSTHCRNYYYSVRESLAGHQAHHTLHDLQSNVTSRHHESTLMLSS